MSPNQRTYIKANHLRMSVKEMADNLKASEQDVETWKAELQIKVKRVTGPKKKPVHVQKEGMFDWGRKYSWF